MDVVNVLIKACQSRNIPVSIKGSGLGRSINQSTAISWIGRFLNMLSFLARLSHVQQEGEDTLHFEFPA